MELPARPTLKALKMLQGAGWTDRAHESAVREERIVSVLPLFELRHPIIEQAAADIAGLRTPPSNEILECVRAHTGEAWLEIKKSGTPWRGAVAYYDGVPWLVFTTPGHDKFYRRLETAMRQNGTAPYKPTEKDLAYLAVEIALMRSRKWRVDNLCRAIECLAKALESGGSASQMLEPAPDDSRPVGELAIEIEQVDGAETLNLAAAAHEQPVELRVSLTFPYGNNRKHEELLARDLRVLLHPHEHDWEVEVKPDGTPRFWALVTEARLMQLFAASRQDGNSATVRVGDFERPSHSHYTTKAELAAATVNGVPVRAVCGHWFVPRNDHLHLPVCARCEADLPVASVLRRLTGGRPIADKPIT